MVQLIAFSSADLSLCGTPFKWFIFYSSRHSYTAVSFYLCSLKNTIVVAVLTKEVNEVCLISLSCIKINQRHRLSTGVGGWQRPFEFLLVGVEGGGSLLPCGNRCHGTLGFEVGSLF